MAQYGKCPVCGDIRVLIKDGTMKQHQGKPYSGDPAYGSWPTPRCDGTGELPEEDEAE